jgi:hypothetical protein
MVKGLEKYGGQNVKRRTEFLSSIVADSKKSADS